MLRERGASWLELWRATQSVGGGTDPAAWVAEVVRFPRLGTTPRWEPLI